MSGPLDPTDFPLFPLPALRLAVQLFPVTRVQFEYMLGDSRRFDLAAYAEILSISPRQSWRTAKGWSVGLSATAVLPEEAEAFAAWLGGGFRLPTDAEWRDVYRLLAKPANLKSLRDAASARAVHPAARALLECALGAAGVPTWREVGLFAGGSLEWVRTGGGYGLQGRPRPGLYQPLIHNPEIHEAVRVRQVSRHAAFGFRLVKPLPAGAA